MTITAVEGSAVADLYQYEGFSEALHYRTDHPRPDVAAAIATGGNGDIVGIAGVKADSETMWQIGVDVVASAREWDRARPRRSRDEADPGQGQGLLLLNGRVTYSLAYGRR